MNNQDKFQAPESLRISPEGIAEIENPKIPLPWQPSQRIRVTRKVMNEAFEKGLSDEVLSDLREYIVWARGRYLLPGDAAELVLRSTDTGTPLSSLIFTHQSEEDYTRMMQRFEGQYLGLEPSNSFDGLHYWESSAGFGGGIYPADKVGALIEMSGEKFLETIATERGQYARVMIVSDNFIIPVYPSRERKNSVVVDGVAELSPAGKEYLDNILEAYEFGLTKSEPKND